MMILFAMVQKCYQFLPFCQARVVAHFKALSGGDFALAGEYTPHKKAR
jgi:hypothetical protein